MITDFLFLPSKASLRFKDASVTLRYESGDLSACELEILAIAPRDYNIMLLTTRQVELNSSTNVLIKVAVPTVRPAISLDWELKKPQE